MATIGAATHAGSRGGIVIDGVDALITDFTYKAARIQGQAGDVAVKHADIAAQHMRTHVSIDSGDTLESISSDQKPTNAGGAVYADAGADWFVARFLEHGTVRMGPRPFVGPAADATIPGFIADIERIGGL